MIDSVSRSDTWKDHLTLDQNGFEVIKSPTFFSEWHDGSKVTKYHYPEIERFLKQKLDAERVVFFDHSVSLNGHAEATSVRDLMWLQSWEDRNHNRQCWSGGGVLDNVSYRSFYSFHPWLNLKTSLLKHVEIDQSRCMSSSGTPWVQGRGRVHYKRLMPNH
jgi:hypothetical protein